MKGKKKQKPKGAGRVGKKRKRPKARARRTMGYY